MQFSQIHLSKHVSEILGKDAQKAGLDFAELGLTTWLPRLNTKKTDSYESLKHYLACFSTPHFYTFGMEIENAEEG